MKKIILIIVTVLFIALSCNSQIIPKTNIVSTNTVLLNVTKSGSNFTLTPSGSTSTQSVISSPNGSVTAKTSNSDFIVNAAENGVSFIVSNADTSVNYSTSNEDGAVNVFYSNNIEGTKFYTYQGRKVYYNDVEIATVKEKFLYLNADVTTTSTVAIYPLLTDTLKKNSRYLITGKIANGCSGSAGLRYNLDFPSTYTVSVHFFGNTTNNTTFSSTKLTAASFTNVYNQSATAVGFVCIEGEIFTGDDDDVLKIGFFSVTNGQTSTIYYQGSNIQYTLLD